MPITRWDPFRDLDEMSGRLNRLFARSELSRLPPNALLANADFSPAVDISETAEEYLIKAELPDVQKENLKVSVEEGVLRISGERKQEKEEKNKKYHIVERSYGSFMRAFQLPSAIDESKVVAEFKEGMLNVRVPKTERATPKSVEIKVS